MVNEDFICSYHADFLSRLKSHNGFIGHFIHFLLYNNLQNMKIVLVRINMIK